MSSARRAAKKRILVAVAGFVAEACWKKETADDLGGEFVRRGDFTG